MNYIIFGIIFIVIVTYLNRKKIFDMKLSKDFYLSEFEHSETAKKLGIENKIPKKYIPNIKLLVNKILQPSRDYMNVPITITSGFRTKELNDNLKGSSKTSDHMVGRAADLVCSDNAKLFNYIKNNLIFDQLIWEKGTTIQPEWVHVSFRSSSNRMMVFKTT